LNDIEKYTELGINKLKDVSILSIDDMDSISNMSEELQREYSTAQLWRTETEIRNAVLNDVSFPTDESKFYQCMKESKVFFEQLVMLSCEFEKVQGELELKEIAYEKLQGTDKKTMAKRKIIGSDIKMKQFGLLNMRLAGHDRVREIKIWNRIKSEIRQRNPNMIINDPNSHQENSFALRWAKQMKVGAETNDAAVYRNSKASLDTLRRNQNG